MSEATKLKAPGATGEVVRSAGEREAKSAARERAGSFGGPRLKLKVFREIPGYQLYWDNDSDGSIEELIHEGFDFVTPAEVGMERKVRSTVVEDKDLDSRVSKHVGKNSAGAPMKAYLLKLPEELWQEREAMKNQQADRWDSSIRRQAGTGIEEGRRYIPKGYETTLTN